MSSEKKLKHARRKVTQEQVDAMNRQLELTGAGFRYTRDQNGRLTEQTVYTHCCW